MILLWVLLLHVATGLPSQITRRTEKTTESNLSTEVYSDMQKIVTKLPNDMKYKIMGSSRQGSEGYFDVLEKSSDVTVPTYIIGNKDKKRYRVRIKPKNRNKGLNKTANNISGFNKTYITSSSGHPQTVITNYTITKSNLDGNNSNIVTVLRTYSENDEVSQNSEASKESNQNNSNEIVGSNNLLLRSRSSETSESSEHIEQPDKVFVSTYETVSSNNQQQQQQQHLLQQEQEQLLQEQQQWQQENQQSNEDSTNYQTLLNICKDLNLKPQDIWLLANRYFGLDIKKTEHLEKFKSLYFDFIDNLRNGTEKSFFSSINSDLDLVGENERELEFTQSMSGDTKESAPKTSHKLSQHFGFKDMTRTDSRNIEVNKTGGGEEEEMFVLTKNKQEPAVDNEVVAKNVSIKMSFAEPQKSRDHYESEVMITQTGDLIKPPSSEEREMDIVIANDSKVAMTEKEIRKTITNNDTRSFSSLSQEESVKPADHIWKLLDEFDNIEQNKTKNPECEDDCESDSVKDVDTILPLRIVPASASGGFIPSYYNELRSNDEVNDSILPKVSLPTSSANLSNIDEDINASVTEDPKDLIDLVKPYELSELLKKESNSSDYKDVVGTVLPDYLMENMPSSPSAPTLEDQKWNNTYSDMIDTLLSESFALPSTVSALTKNSNLPDYVDNANPIISKDIKAPVDEQLGIVNNENILDAIELLEAESPMDIVEKPNNKTENNLSVILPRYQRTEKPQLRTRSTTIPTEKETDYISDALEKTFPQNKDMDHEPHKDNLVEELDMALALLSNNDRLKEVEFDKPKLKNETVYDVLSETEDEKASKMQEILNALPLRQQIVPKTLDTSPESMLVHDDDELEKFIQNDTSLLLTTSKIPISNPLVIDTENDVPLSNSENNRDLSENVEVLPSDTPNVEETDINLEKPIEQNLNNNQFIVDDLAPKSFANSDIQPLHKNKYKEEKNIVRANNIQGNYHIPEEIDLPDYSYATKPQIIANPDYALEPESKIVYPFKHIQDGTVVDKELLNFLDKNAEKSEIDNKYISDKTSKWEELENKPLNSQIYNIKMMPGVESQEQYLVDKNTFYHPNEFSKPKANSNVGLVKNDYNTILQLAGIHFPEDSPKRKLKFNTNPVTTQAGNGPKPIAINYDEVWPIVKNEYENPVLTYKNIQPKRKPRKNYYINHSKIRVQLRSPNELAHLKTLKTNVNPYKNIDNSESDTYITDSPVHIYRVSKENAFRNLLKDMGYPENFIEKYLPSLLEILDEKQLNHLEIDGPKSSNKPLSEIRGSIVDETDSGNYWIKLNVPPHTQNQNDKVKEVFKLLPPELKEQLHRYLRISKLNENDNKDWQNLLRIILVGIAEKDLNEKQSKPNVMMYNQPIKNPNKILGLGVLQEEKEDIVPRTESYRSTVSIERSKAKPNKPNIERINAAPMNTVTYAEKIKKEPLLEQYYKSKPVSSPVPIAFYNDVDERNYHPGKIDEKNAKLNTQKYFLFQTNALESDHNIMVPISESFVVVRIPNLHHLYIHIILSILNEALSNVYQYLQFYRVPTPTILKVVAKIKSILLTNLSTHEQCIDTAIKSFVEKLNFLIETHVLIPVRKSVLYKNRRF